MGDAEMSRPDQLSVEEIISVGRERKLPGAATSPGKVN